MHRGIPRPWTWIVAAAALSAMATGVHAQQYPMADPPYDADEGGMAVQAVADPAGTPDLAARVAELEIALQKAAQKEADEKKKAAGRPTVVVQGRVHADTLFFNQGDESRNRLGDIQDAAYFRSARLGVAGEMFDVFTYRLDVDFANVADYTTGNPNPPNPGGVPDHTHTIRDVDATSFKDVYLGIRELPLAGTVQIGHYKEPFSLEQLTSNRFTSFMERSLADTFVPRRNLGVMAMNTYGDEQGTWALGIFRTMGDIPPFRADDDGGRAITARVTWLPWYDEATEGRGLFHLGAAYSYRDLDTTTLRFSARPEIVSMKDETGANRAVADTGNIADSVDHHLFGPEAAFVYGPFSIQSEWIGTTVNRTGQAPDAYFSGYYFYVSYFLTGENRVYRRSAGVFDRVKPYENFFRVRTADGDVRTGRGAWEILYRYSCIDLQDPGAGINGGTADDHTFGVTWYWNPYAKVLFNYIHTTAARQGAGWAVPMDIFGMRMALEY